MTIQQGGAAPQKVLCVVGARPNFMKIAPLLRAFRMHAPQVEVTLVHTGQHYDYAMNEAFFSQLGIPAPDVSLEVGSASHAVQTGEIMQRFEPVLDEHQPDVVLVVGDVNSTIACALVAAKRGVHVVHVEAGLRSYDRTMPEEINRVLTDQLCTRLYVTERDAIDNLAREGIARERALFVGNVMIDTLLQNLPQAIPSAQTITDAWTQAGQPANAEPFVHGANGYAVLTLHRPSNVDDPAALARLLQTLTTISRDVPLVFPVHPRTRARIEASDCSDFLANPRVLILPPIGYFEMLGLNRDAKLVLTDSGGLQEETTALGVPCLTLRENTERPITISEGTNTLVGVDGQAILAAMADILRSGGKRGRQPELWDGKAAERIVADLAGAAWRQQPALRNS